MGTRFALTLVAMATAIGGVHPSAWGWPPQLPMVPAILAGVGMQQQARPAPESDKLDVNEATREQLEKVPGIGPATARRIIEWRGQHGRFETLDELLNVRGIGTKTLAKLRAYLEVRSADAGTH